MTGRHRRTPTPTTRALLGTVPLLGGAGMAAGLLAGAAPEGTPAPAPVVAALPVAEAPATALPVPEAGATALPVTGVGATAPVGVASGPGPVPGGGEILMDAVAGARDAAQARQAADAREAAEVSTVAEQLRVQAEERAEQARAAGDAELAAYHEAQAEQQRSAGSSRQVVPAPLDSGALAADPGATCTSSDLLRLGPVALAGPDDPDCRLDPWIAGQLEDSLDRVG
ncbi:hypothetical protein [Pseudonocardia sp. NPDC049635]|uniref:hypothetical protein n=1 Tax=Pseudonocardia sp. NPDC049635 TaxID=3155506 RepID=UPI0033DA528C